MAIADRIDTLVGLFGINKIPSFKRPFRFKTYTLGVLRILVEKDLSLDLKLLINWSINSTWPVKLTDNTADSLYEYIMDLVAGIKNVDLISIASTRYVH